jgi:hypothetical protein
MVTDLAQRVSHIDKCAHLRVAAADADLLKKSDKASPQPAEGSRRAASSRWPGACGPAEGATGDDERYVESAQLTIVHQLTEEPGHPAGACDLT